MAIIRAASIAGFSSVLNEDFNQTITGPDCPMDGLSLACMQRSERYSGRPNTHSGFFLASYTHV